MESQTEDERVTRAQGIFKASTKCHSVLMRHPPFHAHCVAALERFARQLLAYVEAHGVLRVNVRQHVLELAGAVVYSEANPQENLALRFFVDGLRELNVLPGVGVERAKELALVFHESLRKRDADSLQLLWDAEIPSVRCVALNSLVDPWKAPESWSPQQKLHVKQMSQDAETIVGKLAVNRRCGQFTMEPSPAATKRTPKVRGTKKVRLALGDRGADVFETYRNELARIRDDLLAWDAAKLLENVVNHTLDGLALAPTIVSEESSEWLLRKAIDLAIERRDMRLLANLVSRLVAERMHADGGTAELLDRVLEWLGGRDVNTRLIAMARGSLGGDAAALCQVLDRLGPVGVTTAVHIYTRAQSGVIGPALLDFVAENLSRNPQAIRPLLGPTVAPDVVSRLIAQLRDQISDDATLAELLKLAREHPDKAVSTAATGIWQESTSQGQLSKVVHLLTDDDRVNRLAALNRLLDANDPRAVPKLRKVIESTEFLGRDKVERSAFMDALGHLGGSDAASFLEAQTRRTTGLFNRSAVKEIRESAQSSLNRLKNAQEQEDRLGD